MTLALFSRSVISRILSKLVVLVSLSFFMAVEIAAQVVEPVTEPATEQRPAYKLTDVAGPLFHPWAVAELPDGRLLVTERSGQLRLINGTVTSAPIENLPAIFAKSQGGLFDIALHPDYSNNGWIYISFAHGTDRANATRLIRARLHDESLVDIEVLFTASPPKNTAVHFGGRLTFLPDQTLLLTIGDGFEFREEAQRLDTYLGKIVRLNDDGSIPEDNPYLQTEGALPALWSIGHRNPQSIVYDGNSEQVYATEHGPAGGDEVNIIQRANNYGWPIATLGRDYSGAAISPYTHYPGTTPPLVDWTPSIAPSGMAIVFGDAFPAWRGDLLVAALKSREVRRVRFSGGEAVEQESLFTELNTRIRDVRLAADGTLFLLTDSPTGRLIHVTPN